MLNEKEKFIFDDAEVDGTLILENNTSKVYMLPDMSHIGFSGTSTIELKKEFPEWDLPIGEQLLNTFILIKDGKAVLDYDYE